MNAHKRTCTCTCLHACRLSRTADKDRCKGLNTSRPIKNVYGLRTQYPGQSCGVTTVCVVVSQLSIDSCLQVPLQVDPRLAGRKQPSKLPYMSVGCSMHVASCFAAAAAGLVAAVLLWLFRAAAPAGALPSTTDSNMHTANLIMLKVIFKIYKWFMHTLFTL